MNKKKIFNDPVYGFITIPGELIFDIIEHPWFQRLRRIKQLGLTDLVYPGALHTRFHHALGAMHLMGTALDSLRSKGHDISDEEYEAAQIGILLHDLGHGPFSHALEHTLLDHTSHESISLYLLSKLNEQFQGKLALTIKMFSNVYERKFFHQLISSQLDIDRMDYLQRDCFFTGVSEGTIATDRIIKMLDVKNDQLVIEEKGIYSIENFLTARRLMYWQVYLHKTTVAAEKMLISVIERAQELSRKGHDLDAPSALKPFLYNKINLKNVDSNTDYFEAFVSLDDYDIWTAIKSWSKHSDKTLNFLCNSILLRRLFKIEISQNPFLESKIDGIRFEVCKKWGIKEEELKYFVINGTLTNAGYLSKEEQILILMKNGSIIDVAEASDLPNIKAIRKIVKKHYLCHPKNVYLYYH